MAKVALLIDKKAAEKRWRYGINVFECYMDEVLSHAGIPFERLDAVEEFTARQYDVIIAALEDEDPETTSQIVTFAEQGGTVISYGRLPSLAEKLGCIQHVSNGESYVFLPEQFDVSVPLRCLKVNPWIPASGASLCSEQIGSISMHHPNGDQIFSALQHFIIGKGSIRRWAVDIPFNIVGFQQGLSPVITDGVPAPDGTARINEGILKADDGMEMDWAYDRLNTETGTAYFAYPYADLWRKACISHLLRTVVELGLTLPFIGYWPDGIRSVAMISHDSDGNVDEHAESTLNVLKEAQIQSTWCMLEPGYSPDIYRKVEQDGHELGFHYNALEIQGGTWNEAEFERQLNWLRKAAGMKNIISNKNHFTRFEGWGELFQWCERHGIEVDQSRGPSKGGNVGFLFGTCHPFLPVAWFDEQNRLYDVLELGFLTQDMDIGGPWSDSSIITPFLNQVMQVEGIAHFLFHQVHLHSLPKVTESFRRLVNEARQMGFTFWTSKQINAWERARRSMRIEGLNERGTVKVGSDVEMMNVVVWVPFSGNAVQSDEVEIRFGLPCKKQLHHVVSSLGRGDSDESEAGLTRRA